MTRRLTHRCGRCGEKAELEVVHHTRATNVATIDDIMNGEVSVETLIKDTRVLFSLLCVCPRCEGATVVDFKVNPIYGKDFLSDIDEERDVLVKPTYGVEEVGFYPSRNSWRDIAGVPPKLCELMEEIDELIGNGHRAHIIISSTGTALELLLRHLGSPGKKEDLFKRIEDLAGRGVITNPLKQWAHHLRNKRNFAVHEAVGSSEDAVELFKFLCTLVELTVGLPHRIQQIDQRAITHGPEGPGDGGVGPQ